MNSLAALSAGGRQSMRLFKITALFYAMNLAMAAVIVAPLAVAVAGNLSRSLESARLFSNFDVGWLMEFSYQYRGGTAVQFAVLTVVVGLCSLVLNTFLAGGAIALFEREDDAFFSASARYFPRLARLALVSLVFYGFVAALFGVGSRLIGKASESSMEAGPWIMLRWGLIGVAVFLAGVVNMTFDYAKIVLVTGEARGAVRATMRAAAFVASRPARTLAVYWICGAAALGMLAAYHGLSEFATQETVTRVVLVLVFRQAYVLFRIWARLWTWSSEVHAYEAAPLPVAEPEPPIPSYVDVTQGAAADPETLS